MLLKLICLNLLVASNANVRERRYLVYPDGGPARAQFIIGLGVPVDLKEASVTVGTVIKFQYDLPTNSTEYTSRIYGFANTVSRDMDGDVSKAEEEENKGNEIDANLSRNFNIVDNSTSDERSEADNDTLVDITFDDRRKRSLLYSEGGSIDDIEGSDIKAEISLEEAIRRQETLDKKHIEENPEPQRMNRWDFYKIIEHMIGRYGYSGRPCLLRTICEAAEVPFTYENGLLGEIGHILFTPSTTKDVLSHHTDNEFHAAERLGRDAGADCESMFPECESSILDTFTGIGIDTLHKFGLY
ncbi:jg27896 [Pararge aegeria aegeria]|uniref:Jg27896 protein n=1 Tax=Pararge aegeria aegeria TaxID=348720 RepID=A0A8S4SG77_9NEOP|nr:jg27896 [Pararge aegeria aegeria]